MSNKKIQRSGQKEVSPSTGEKIRVVIRNMDDVINFQILRWKRQYPEAAEPEEWSANEIGPNDHYRPEEDIAEADEAVILKDDERWIGASAGKGMVRRGTYAKGYQQTGENKEGMSARLIQAEIDRLAHYDKALAGVLNDLQKEFGDEYEIVYEGEYAERILGEGKEVPDPTKKGIRANY